ncbi:MAG: sugar phosphate isomerase/epimerase [Deltaproteobacteria bacterium]|nr:MAG: sugar phosphate isomerase/epimerase [Deltaproteobacteria bacterium]
MSERISLKGVTSSFRFGTTSYIIPDDILPNLSFLSSLVDDVEIVLFESPEKSNLPGKSVVKEMKRVVEEERLSVTVHLPIDEKFPGEEGRMREKRVDALSRVIEIFEELGPRAYILHADFPDWREGLEEGEVRRWREGVLEALSLLRARGAPVERFCLENLDYPPSLLREVATPAGASLCGDIGHVLIHGFDVDRFIDEFLPLCRVVHLHGASGGRDHLSPRFLPDGVLSRVLAGAAVSGSTDVVTLEVFGLADFDSACEAVLEVLRE